MLTYLHVKLDQNIFKDWIQPMAIVLYAEAADMKTFFWGKFKNLNIACDEGRMNTRQT